MSRKIESLQSLRTLAFMGIFLCHAGAAVSWAELGVTIFFVLSGFLLVRLYHEQELDNSLLASIKFSFRKIKKLYLLHIITMLLAFLVSFITIVYKGITVEGICWLVIKTVLNITLLQTWIPVAEINFSLNTVSWFLSVMMFLYAVFPTLLKFIKKIRDKTKLIILSIIVIILQLAVAVFTENVNGIDGNFFVWLTYCFPLYRLGDFIIGCNIGYLCVNGCGDKVSPNYATIWEMLVGVITIILLTIIKQGHTSTWLKAICNQTTLYIPISVVLILVFYAKKGYITSFLSNRVLIYLGNISAYMFLIHNTIILYINTVLSFLHIPFEGSLQVALIVFELVLTIACSVLYLKFENKVNDFIHRKRNY